LCYAHGNSSTSEEDGVNGQQRVVCRMTSVTSDQHEECDEFYEEDDNPYSTPYQPRSFCVAANAWQGMRDEQYILSRVFEALHIGK
jgi:hypothetical protein